MQGLIKKLYRSSFTISVGPPPWLTTEQRDLCIPSTESKVGSRPTWPTSISHPELLELTRTFHGNLAWESQAIKMVEYFKIFDVLDIRILRFIWPKKSWKGPVNVRSSYRNFNLIKSDCIIVKQILNGSIVSHTFNIELSCRYVFPSYPSRIYLRDSSPWPAYSAKFTSTYPS